MNKFKLSVKEKDLLDFGFFKAFGTKAERYFSAPGRIEIGGNHTDHQRGKVIAGAINLDSKAAVRRNRSGKIRVLSEGYPLLKVDLNELEPMDTEANTSTALVRGVAACFVELGVEVNGFDAYCISDVLPGSGLSSSAAFEVLIATIVNHIFNKGKTSAIEVAKIGQYAENVFFKKPCGLMDQTASSVGGLITIDFKIKENPNIRPIIFDFDSSGHAICIIDTFADHVDLTEEYAAITEELGKISSYFGKEVLTEINEDDFYMAVSELRKECGDRALMRAMHVFEENMRVARQVECLEKGDFERFLKLVKESGKSSWMYLQNVIPVGNVRNQEMAVVLGLCAHFLKGRGAYRVHGGGFGGTVQAFVPFDILDDFKHGIESTLGEGSCHILSIRNFGGVEAFPESR